MPTDPTLDPALVELVTASTEQHHIVSGRTDAMGNNPCVCDEWWDSADMPGWDEHMAEVAVAALAAEGRLLPPDAVTRTEWGIRGNLAGEVVETSTADALDLCPTYGTPVTRTVWVGPWLPAPEETP